MSDQFEQRFSVVTIELNRTIQERDELKMRVTRWETECANERNKVSQLVSEVERVNRESHMAASRLNEAERMRVQIGELQAQVNRLAAEKKQFED